MGILCKFASKLRRIYLSFRHFATHDYCLFSMNASFPRQRAKRKKIRVTFPDGTVICFGNVTETFIATLCKIGAERFPEINLELCHLPLLTREIYPQYEAWIKPVCDGWYVNIQSDTGQKYIQLRSISDSLNLGLTVEIGDDFEEQEKTKKGRSRKSKENLSVTFPDGETVTGPHAIDAFLGCIRKMGIDNILRKGIEWGGNPFITRYQTSSRQVEVEPNRWALIPNTTKDRVKLLKVIAIHLRMDVEITTV